MQSGLYDTKLENQNTQLNLHGSFIELPQIAITTRLQRAGRQIV